MIWKLHTQHTFAHVIYIEEQLLGAVFSTKQDHYIVDEGDNSG